MAVNSIKIIFSLTTILLFIFRQNDGTPIEWTQFKNCLQQNSSEDWTEFRTCMLESQTLSFEDTYSKYTTIVQTAL